MRPVADEPGPAPPAAHTPRGEAAGDRAARASIQHARAHRGSLASDPRSRAGRVRSRSASGHEPKATPSSRAGTRRERPGPDTGPAATARAASRARSAYWNSRFARPIEPSASSTASWRQGAGPRLVRLPHTEAELHGHGRPRLHEVERRPRVDRLRVPLRFPPRPRFPLPARSGRPAASPFLTCLADRATSSSHGVEASSSL